MTPAGRWQTIEPPQASWSSVRKRLHSLVVVGKRVKDSRFLMVVATLAVLLPCAGSASAAEPISIEQLEELVSAGVNSVDLIRPVLDNHGCRYTKTQLVRLHQRRALPNDLLIFLVKRLRTCKPEQSSQKIGTSRGKAGTPPAKNVPIRAEDLAQLSRQPIETALLQLKTRACTFSKADIIRQHQRSPIDSKLLAAMVTAMRSCRPASEAEPAPKSRPKPKPTVSPTPPPRRAVALAHSNKRVPSPPAAAQASRSTLLEQPPTQESLYPLRISLNASGAFNYWLPESIPFAELRTSGFGTFAVELVLSLWDTFYINKLRFETTFGSPPTTKESFGEFLDDEIAGLLLDTALSLVFDGHGPGILYRYELYNGTFQAKQPMSLADAQLDIGLGDTLPVVPAGWRYRFHTEFHQLIGGYAREIDSETAVGRFLVGVGYLAYNKPWALKKLKEPHVFFSNLEGWGFGGMADVELEDLPFYIRPEFFVGYGDIELTSRVSMAELLKDNGLKIAFLAARLDAGVDISIVDNSYVYLDLKIEIGAAFSHFWLADDDGKQVESGALTHDFRFYGGLELTLGTH